MSLQSYRELISQKRVAFEPRGFTDVRDRDLPASLFDHQKHGVEFALRSGCSAQFYDTGLGKTAIALSWADGVIRRFIGTELKDSYFRQAVKYLSEAQALGGTADLFGSAA